MDHDRLFKELLTTFFAEFVDLFLPQMGAYIDRASIEFLDKELFSDVAAGERREADIVARVRFRVPPGEAAFPPGPDVFFLIHVENQATAQKGFPRRLFFYFARLLEKYGLPVYPVAIFSYDAPLRAEPDRYTVSFPDKTVLDFSYTAVQLNRLNWRDFLRQPNPVASALMAKMRIAPEDRAKAKLECLRMLVTLRLDPARAHLVSAFVDSYLRLNAVEQKSFQEELSAEAPQEETAVMELTTSWKEEGIEIGRVQGRQEGRQEGLRDGASRLARRRFPEGADALEEPLRRLSPAALEEFVDALLDFPSPQAARDWLRDRQTA